MEIIVFVFTYAIFATFYEFTIYDKLSERFKAPITLMSGALIFILASYLMESI